MERPRHGTGHLADLERMGQPVAEMIAIVLEKHLGLVLQPAKGGGMDDAVTIPLELAAGGTGAGAIDAAQGQFGFGGVNSGIAHR